MFFFIILMVFMFVYPKTRLQQALFTVEFSGTERGLPLQLTFSKII